MPGKEGINYDEIVENRDTSNIADLINWSCGAADRAKDDSCGCPQCKGEARRARRIEGEYIMTVVNAPEVDHEEAFIASVALRKLLGE